MPERIVSRHYRTIWAQINLKPRGWDILEWLYVSHAYLDKNTWFPAFVHSSLGS